MVSLALLCLILLSSVHAEDQWKEQLRNGIFRATNLKTWWSGLNWGRPTTTQRTSTRSATTATTMKISSSATAVSSSSFTTFQNEALAETNKFRTMHCVPPLKLNATLNSIAYQYAVQLVAIGQLVHSKSGYGENLFYTGSSQPMDISSINGSKPIDSWYKEETDYIWAKPGFSSTTGHFTQLVWKATQQCGIGIACTTDRTKCYIVANYSPPGNYDNQYEANVLRPSCK